MHKRKVTLWANGCGADVGRCRVHFTGVKVLEKTGELVYVTIPNRTWSSRHMIRNRSAESLRAIVRQAYTATGDCA